MIPYFGFWELFLQWKYCVDSKYQKGFINSFWVVLSNGVLKRGVYSLDQKLQGMCWKKITNRHFLTTKIQKHILKRLGPVYHISNWNIPVCFFFDFFPLSLLLNKNLSFFIQKSGTKDKHTKKGFGHTKKWIKHTKTFQPRFF